MEITEWRVYTDDLTGEAMVCYQRSDLPEGMLGQDRYVRPSYILECFELHIN
jgi:hypothetical protein